MFESEDEYQSFLTWAIEGSTIGQRMNSGAGDEIKIPDHWKKLKPVASKLPKTLKELQDATP